MRPRRRFRSRSALAVTVVACAFAVVAAGTLVHSHDSGAPAAEMPSWQQTLRHIGHRYAECLRQHGHPQIADPTLASDGRLSFGAQDDAVSAASRALRGNTCLSELMALKDAPPKPPTAAELRQLVRFSQCVRKHGMPDWPDPNPDGTFPLSQRLRDLGKGAIFAALEPCRRLNPGGGIQISRPSPGAKS
jgi:hypothetical protein